MGFGLIVIFVGFIYLMKNLGIITADVLDWSILWPILVILCGLAFIGKGRCHHFKHHSCKGESCEDCKKK